MLKLEDVYISNAEGDLVMSVYYDQYAVNGSRFTIPSKVIKMIDRKTLVRKLLIGYRELSQRADGKLLFAGPGIALPDYASEVQGA